VVPKLPSDTANDELLASASPASMAEFKWHLKPLATLLNSTEPRRGFDRILEYLAAFVLT
jgi:hypothetical protein